MWCALLVGGGTLPLNVAHVAALRHGLSVLLPEIIDEGLSHSQTVGLPALDEIIPWWQVFESCRVEAHAVLFEVDTPDDARVRKKVSSDHNMTRKRQTMHIGNIMFSYTATHKEQKYSRHQSNLEAIIF